MATPPILQRSSYPPGQPSLGAAPQPLGKVPTGLSQIEKPGTILGTQYQGPLISGPAPGVNGAIGSARLSLCLQVDYTMGNFQLPIQFPGGSFLQSIDCFCYQNGLSLTVIMLGTQSGQGDIQTVVLPAENAFVPTLPPLVQLPLWDAVAPKAPFQMWINVSANTGQTAGGVIVAINYLRLTGPWSQPA